MSIRIMSQVWDLDLPDSEKLVLLSLADRADDEGFCWPSVATLAKKCSKSERTVRYAISSLIEKGHLTKEERFGTSSNYWLHPCNNCTPAKSAPLQGTHVTPAITAPNTSNIHQKNNKRAHTMPDGWCPLGFKEGSKSYTVASTWTGSQAAEHIEAFTAYHNSRGSKFVDWQSAWSTWVMNSAKFGGTKSATTTSDNKIRNSFVRATLAREADRQASQVDIFE